MNTFPPSFSTFPIRNLERKKESSLALEPRFSCSPRAVIVPLPPSLLTPCVFLFLIFSESFVYSAPFMAYFFFFLFFTCLVPGSKGLRSIHLTTFSQFKEKQPTTQTLSWHLPGVCCRLLFLSISPQCRRPAALSPLPPSLHTFPA